MRSGNVFGRVCLSVCTVLVLNVESFNLETSFLVYIRYRYIGLDKQVTPQRLTI